MNPFPAAPNTPSQLSDSVQHQLNLYALASTAAGVSLLALVPAAEAKVVYTPVHIVIQEYDSYRLALNHATTDLSIKVNVFSNGQSAQDVVSALPRGKNEIEGTARHSFYAAALTKGATIGPKQKFGGESKSALMASVDESQYGSFHYGGNWANVKSRYLGVKFQINGKAHYGWVRAHVWVTGQGPGAGAILTGYAYETIPNKPIVAGETKGPAPKLATLGALALGRK